MSLPVDPERLKAEFPDVSSDDLDAYVQVTKRVLAAGPKERPKLIRQILDGALDAREKEMQGKALTDQERLWIRYRAAVEKMQGPTARR
jgi:hypothetical protein